MFDLDRFKHVNDTYGHQVGDRVLQEMARILRSTAREIDKLGRYGGEEFIAILPDTGIDEAADLRRARARTGRAAPVRRRAGSIRST